VEIVDLILASAPAFLFVLVRTASILVAAPLFGANTVPLQLKMGLAVLISLVVMPMTGPVAVPQGLVYLALGLAGEVLIGAAIGIAIRFIFSGIEYGAQLASFQMGIGMATAYDPMNGAQITVLGRFVSVLLLLIFLSVNGHLMIILALKKCFEVIPPYGMSLSGEFMENFVLFSKEVFVLAVKFSAPVVAILIFVNVALGIMGRTVPQVNMFAVGFSVTIGVGLVVMALSMPVFEESAKAVFEQMWVGVSLLIKGMANG
jgi:flagellar biosynthetic protein FliR